MGHKEKVMAVAMVGCLALPMQALAVSLDECVDASFRKSAELVSLDHRVTSAKIALERDSRGLLPTLSVSDEAAYSTFGSDSGITDGMDNKANAEFELDLQKFVSRPQRQSALAYRRAQVLTRQARTQLRLEVIQAFNRCLLMVRKDGEHARAMAFVDGHIHDIQRLQNMGMDVALDLLRAESQRKALDLASNNDDAQFQASLGVLNGRTGLDLGAKDFDPAQAQAIAETVTAQEVEARVAGRLMRVAASQLAAIDLESAQVAVDASGPLSAPLVHLGLDHSFAAADPATPLNRGYASFSLPLVDWGQKALEARQLRADLEVQRLEGEAQAQDLRLQATQLASDLAHAQKAYGISSDVAQDSEKGMEIAKAYYRQGKVKETDLLSVFSDYLTAQDQRDDALLECMDKQAEWSAFWEDGRP